MIGNFLNALIRRQLDRERQRVKIVKRIEKWASSIDQACELARDTGDRDLSLFCIHSADQLESFVADFRAQGLL